MMDAPTRTATPTKSPAPDPAPSFRNVLAFEWTKFLTARATCWTLITMSLMLPIMSVIVAATESIQADDTILGGSLTGAVIAQLVGGAVGALAISTEYTTGTIRTTLVAVPRRDRVLAAKAIVVAGLLFISTIASSLVAFGIGLIMLDGDVYETGDPLPALIGVGAAVAMVGLLGVAVGTLVRRSAGAIAGVAAVMFAPAFLAPFLGDYERWLGGVSPVAVVQKLTQSSDASHDATGSLSGWPSLAVALIGVGVVLAFSGRSLDRHDA